MSPPAPKSSRPIWALRDHEEDRQINEEIDVLDDRAAAIIAAARLEDALTAAIRSRLTPNTKIENAFFKGMGPLATFSAKIDISFLLGMQTEETHKWFHTVRNIRNEFAHNRRSLTFDSQKINDLSLNLMPLARLKEFANFISSSWPHEERRDYVRETILDLAHDETPRGYYLRTVGFLLSELDFSLMALFANHVLREKNDPDVFVSRGLIQDVSLQEKFDEPPLDRSQNDSRTPTRPRRRPRSSPG